MFLVLAILIELVMVFFFVSVGLGDKFRLNVLSITISPLFHLVPFGVVIVLVSSWVYLTKYLAMVSPKRQPRAHKKPTHRRSSRNRKTRVKSLKSAKRFLGVIAGKLRNAIGFPRRFFSRLGETVFRGHEVTFMQQRPSPTKGAIKSTVAIFLIFSVSVIGFYIVARPETMYNIAEVFYRTNSSFHSFVLESIDIGKGVMQALSPLDGLASSVDNGLRTVAPSFRTSLEGMGAPFRPLSKIDLTWVYLLCQNFSAWISAFIALLYGYYASHSHRIQLPR